MAGPESTGCVIAADTEQAPWAISASAALHKDPPVSQISSTRRQLLPSTSP